MSATIKLNDFEATFIQEASTMSGHSESVIRDVMESLFLRQLEQAAQEQDINIPYIGKLHIRASGDALVGGEREAQFDCFFAPSDLFRRVIGEIQDGDSEFVADLFQKKIGAVLQEKLETRG